MNTYPSLAERVLGVTPPFNNPDAMLSQAYETLTGERGADIEQLLAQNANVYATVRNREAVVGLPRALYELEPAVLERSVTLNTLTHIFRDRGAAYGTLLGTIPLYHALYTEHVAPLEQKPPDRTALLVGSISPVSSAAFVALSECVLHAEPWVVDPKNDHYNQLHGNFVKANGLALPDEWAGSVHTVVTNRLLHMLVGTDGQLAIEATAASGQSASHKFASAMFRLLETGGHLLLCEQPPQIDTEDRQCEGSHNRQIVATFDVTTRTALSEAGFSNIHIGDGWIPESPDFLFQPFNPSQPFPRGKEMPYTRAIYAQKGDSGTA